jgi:hypothetical protein
MKDVNCVEQKINKTCESSNDANIFNPLSAGLGFGVERQYAKLKQQLVVFYTQATWDLKQPYSKVWLYVFFCYLNSALTRACPRGCINPHSLSDINFSWPR